MSDHDALLRAVCEHPDDDTPRLVMADWYQENGDPDRGEFIRLEVEIANHTKGGMPPIVWCRANLDAPLFLWMKRRAELWLANRGRWQQGLPAIGGIEWHWSDNRRGFADEVWARNGVTFLRRVRAIFRSAPVRRLTVSSIRHGTEWLQCDSLRQLRRVKVYSIYSGAAEMLFTGDSPFDALERLTLAQRDIMPALREAISARFGARVEFET